MSDISDAMELNEIQKNFMKKLFDQFAREQRLIQHKVAIVASGGTTTSSVYFPPDILTESNQFKNKTGRTLVNGEKVYVFCKYGETDQGWIID